MERKKILIVEDHRDVRIGLNARLKAAGYDTAFAVDAVSATSVVRRERPDLVLLDLGLPGGDGFVVLERLRAMTHLPAIPVIVLSARPIADNAARARELGAVGYFQKPVRDRLLLRTIELILDPVHLPTAVTARPRTLAPQTLPPQHVQPRPALAH